MKQINFHQVPVGAKFFEKEWSSSGPKMIEYEKVNGSQGSHLAPMIGEPDHIGHYSFAPFKKVWI